MGNARIKHVGSKFTIVPNQIMDDPTISFRAKGVYAYLRSKPDNWEYRVQNITRAGKEGRDAIQTAIKELESAGYIERVANQVEGGKYHGWIWYIYETPINRDTDRLPENPSVGFPVRRFSRPSVFQGDYNNTVLNNTIHNNTIDNNNAVETVIIDIFNQEGIHISAKTVQDILLMELSNEKIRYIASVLGDRKRKGKVKNPAGLLRNNPEVISAILDGTFYPDVKHGTASPKNNTQEGDIDIYCPPEKTEKWMICSAPAPKKIKK